MKPTWPARTYACASSQRSDGVDVEARFSASAWVGQWRPHTSFRPREEKLSTTSAT